ncbi:hypothetical protein [Moraxella lacunata]|uniref:hypothetical protein n=1 Tax=Moraxella lacunata TaxID=477 RepID=UPI003EDE7C98
MFACNLAKPFGDCFCDFDGELNVCNFKKYGGGHFYHSTLYVDGKFSCLASTRHDFVPRTACACTAPFSWSHCADPRP